MKMGPEEKEMYHELFDINPQPMWVYMLDSFEVIHLNQAACALYGYTADEFPIRALLNPLPFVDVSPDNIPEPIIPIRNVSFGVGQFMHQKKGGQIIHIRADSRTIDIKGRKAELVVATDVSANFRAEQDNSRTNEILLESQKIARLGYWTRMADERTYFWSEHMFTIYGQDPKSFIPDYQNFTACLHPDDAYMLTQSFFKTLKAGIDNDVKHRIITSTGEVKWIFQRLHLSEDEGGKFIGISGIAQDITESKQFDEKFKAVFDYTTDAILIADNDGRLLDFNNAALKLFGYSSEELHKKTLDKLIVHPGENKYKKYWKHFLGGKIRSGFMELLGKNGSVISVRFNAKPEILRGSHLCVLSDITGQVTKEQQLQASERRLKALVHEGSDLIGIIDIDGTYRFVADSSLPILGIHPKEFIGRNAFDYIHPGDLAQVMACFAMLRERKQIKTEPFRFRDSKGNYKWILTIGTNMTDDPAVAGIVVNSRDITDDVIKSKELNLSNERYRVIMKAANEAVYDWDIENDHVEWGIGFYEVFGYDLSIHQNNLWTDNVFVEDKIRVLRELTNAVNCKEKIMLLGECQFCHANGNVLHVEYRIIFLRNQAGVAIRAIGTIRDISGYKMSLNKVRLQNERLREIAWAQSHLVRAPLARIMGLINLICNYPNTETEQKELLDHILFSARELDDIVREISGKANEIEPRSF